MDYPLLKDLDDSFETSANTQGYNVTIERDDLAQNPRNVFDGGVCITSQHSNNYVTLDESGYSFEWLKFFKLCLEDPYQSVKYDDGLNTVSIPVCLFFGEGEGVYTKKESLELIREYKKEIAFIAPIQLGTLKGFAVFTWSELKEKFGFNWKLLNSRRKQKLQHIANKEAEEYTAWCEGEVFQYTIIDESGIIVDDCCGFYGDDHNQSGIFDSIHYAVSYELKRKREAHQKYIKTMIKNRVPLQKRISTCH